MARPHLQDSATLLANLRSGDPRAAREFARRFNGVLKRSGRRLGLEPSDLPELIATVLDDVMLHLMQSSAAAPENLESYVVVVLRNTVRREVRLAATRGADNEISLEAARHELRTAAASADAGSDDHPDGEPADDGPADEALRRLYEPVLSGLTPEQRELLGYMLDHVPARVVAQWLGIEHAAARVRIHRLRRLVRTRILARLPLMNARDRAHVERLLRRAGVVLSAPAPADGGERAETRTDNTRSGA
ncbi:MAG TPA: hypothetical protein VFZ56_13990 [Gemmatimonadaceae bacterium]